MYLVDSNVLIDAKNRYYAFDIAPAHAGSAQMMRRSGARLELRN